MTYGRRTPAAKRKRASDSLTRRLARWWRQPPKRKAPGTSFLPTTFAEQTWQQTRKAASRWAIAGGVLGAIVTIIAFAPAAWLASALNRMTDNRLVLSEARGTIWSGDAVVVLTGGLGSQDASALPGRLAWRFVPRLTGLDARLSHPEIIATEITVELRPHWGRFQVNVPPSAGMLGQWPASWLTGLGTPWNTVQPGGYIRPSTTGFYIEWIKGQAHMHGNVEIFLTDVSSRMSTLDKIGSYRIAITGEVQDPSGKVTSETSLSVNTLEGGLEIEGQGVFNAKGFHFSGAARAKPDSEAVLNNLLNIIGRRQGPLSIITIG